MCALVFFRSGILSAQDTNNQNPPPRDHQPPMLEFLSSADRDKAMKAHMKALEDNPNLKAEDMALMKQRPGPDASQEDRRAYREKWMTHEQKIRQAMLKEDSSLGSIFEQIDKHMSQMRAQHENSSGGKPPPPPPDGTNAPPKGNGAGN